MARLPHWLGRLAYVLPLAIFSLAPRAAHAVPPPANGLAFANSYGTVSFEQVAPTPAEVNKGAVVCYRFKVFNTQQPLANPSAYDPLYPNLPPATTVSGFGIKGLVVYHPVAPVCISNIDRTSETLYQNRNDYSWWDHNGSEDADGNGLQDRITEPQETNTGPNSGYTDRDNLYRLCYGVSIDPTQYQLGLHVVEPVSEETFFAFGDCRVTGKVVCVGTTTPVAGAKVELIRKSDNQVVASRTTGADGTYVFGKADAGNFCVRVSHVDFVTFTSAAFATCNGATTAVNVGLTPLPVCYRYREELFGRVFFSDNAFFQAAATTGITLTEADLSNGAFRTPTTPTSNFITSYEYRGVIPSFPELGHFGDAGEPRIWVFMSEPLLPEDRYNGYSFTNQVGVRELVGTKAVGTAGVYTYRMQFNQPFDCPGNGTAYNYTLTGVTFQHNQSTTPPILTQLDSVKADGSAGVVSGGTIPAGYMARARVEFTLAPGSTTTLFVNGKYQDVCGHPFDFSIHPEAGDGR